jgi:hypothetical protein
MHCVCFFLVLGLPHMRGVALITAQRLLMELTQFLFCFSATLVYVLEFIIDLGAARYNSKNLDWAYCTFRFKFHCKEVASLSAPLFFIQGPPMTSSSGIRKPYRLWLCFRPIIALQYHGFLNICCMSQNCVFGFSSRISVNLALT